MEAQNATAEGISALAFTLLPVRTSLCRRSIQAGRLKISSVRRLIVSGGIRPRELVLVDTLIVGRGPACDITDLNDP
jgi:hypothetical protein